MRLIFHLGVHKTGSTLIQENLSENVPALRAQGFYYANVEMPRVILRQRRHLRALQYVDRETPVPDALVPVNAALREAAASAGAHTILISEENRIGLPLYDEVRLAKDRLQFYPLAHTCLSAVLRGLEMLETRLILYHRRFESLLPSLYSEALRNLSTELTFDDFLKQVDFESLDYEALYGRIRRGAAHAELVTVPFEALKFGAEAHLRDFFVRCGIETEELRLSTQIVREGVDSSKAEALRRLAGRARAEGMRREIARARRRVLARPNDPSLRIEMPEWALAFLRGTRMDAVV